MKAKFTIELELADGIDTEYIKNLLIQLLPNQEVSDLDRANRYERLSGLCQDKPVVTEEKQGVTLGDTNCEPVTSAEGECVLMVEEVRRKVYVAKSIVNGFQGDGIYDGQTHFAMCHEIAKGIVQGGALNFDSAPIDFYNIRGAMPVLNGHVQTFIPLNGKDDSECICLVPPKAHGPHSYPVERIQISDFVKDALTMSNLDVDVSSLYRR